MKNGQEIELKMKQWFRGSNHPEDCVDFQTSTSLYEVKSCNLFNGCKGTRNLTDTRQLGRFNVIFDNHILLKATAEIENKIPKYIFVIIVGKQTLWKTMSWADVDAKLHTRECVVNVRVADLFYR